MSGPTGPTGPTGTTGPGFTITVDKLDWLNVTNLTDESLYVNSMILQTENATLFGNKEYTISIAPPALNQTVLYSNLQNAFIGCTVSPIITSGYTGYKISWT
jgi:hypothetical protein